MTTQPDPVAPAAPILPDVDDPIAAPFWAAAREGRLVIQACGDCGTLRTPPRSFCHLCASESVVWRQAKGTGRLWSWIVAHGPTIPAFAGLTPYPVVVVELDDGPGLRMVGNLVADHEASIASVPPGHLAIGMPVAVLFRAIDERVTLPLWCAPAS